MRMKMRTKNNKNSEEKEPIGMKERSQKNEKKKEK